MLKKSINCLLDYSYATTPTHTGSVCFAFKGEEFYSVHYLFFHYLMKASKVASLDILMGTIFLLSQLNLNDFIKVKSSVETLRNGNLAVVQRHEPLLLDATLTLKVLYNDRICFHYF